MAQEYVLPLQCRNCGMIFDLWYDLIESDQKNSEEMQEKLGQELAESLCWKCKEKIMGFFNSSGKEDSSVDDFFIELDLEA